MYILDEYSHINFVFTTVFLAEKVTVYALASIFNYVSRYKNFIIKYGST